MRANALLAFGLANLATAQNTTTTFHSPNPSNPSTSPSTNSPSPMPKPGGFPPQIGDFQFYGCVSSSAGFPTFEETASSREMTLEFCAASCPTRFFGVYSGDCWCGEEIDDSNTMRVPNSMCSTPCPGDDSEYCGGMVNTNRLARRQSVPMSTLFTMYVRVLGEDQPNDDDAGAGGDGADGGSVGDDAAGPGGAGGAGGASGAGITPGSGTPGSTYTRTYTSTGTITACPPEVTDCPVGKATVTTITETICPETEPTPPPTPDHHKVIICYGDYCARPQPCHECEKERVICDGNTCRSEVCEGTQGPTEHHKLVTCNGEDCEYPQCDGEACQKKVVCYGGSCIHEKCIGDECNTNLVCNGDDCGHQPCDGEECHQKIVCESEECKPEPPCQGDCPTPPPPAPLPSPQPTPSPTPSPGPAPPCSGEDCPHPPPVAGSDKILPALGLGALAGLAFFL